MKIKRTLSILLCAAAALSMFALTAFAAVKDTTKDVTLTIYALESEDGSDVAVDISVTGEKITVTDKKSIEGAGFALYRMDGAEDADEDPDAEPDFVTGLTDSTGSVTVTIPAASQGRYLVVEDRLPENAIGSTIPFLVDLPMTTPDGTDYIYNVYAYPKEEIQGAALPEDTDTDEGTDIEDETDKDLPNPEIDKKVSDDCKTWTDTANIASIIGNKAYWKVSVKVPSSIGKMNLFMVGDDVEERLIPPKADEVKASVSGTELSADAYKASVSGRTITVDFKPSKIEAYKDKWIDIIYATSIDLEKEDAIGELIPNFATLTYTRLKDAPDTDGVDSDTDVPGPDGEPEPTPTREITSPTVDVWTSEIKGFKHDGDKKALAGAEFTLYSDKDCKQKIKTAASDDKGIFEFKGVKDGTYYIKETKAPDGYVLNENTLEVKVLMKNNKITEIDVLNVPKTNLPVTGGAGIIGLTAAGLSIALLGGLFILLALRSRRKAALASA